LRPLLLVGDVPDVAVEALQSLGLEVLDFFEVLVFAEYFAGSVEELPEAVVGDKVGLLEEALFDFIVEFLFELSPRLVDLSLDVADCFPVVVAEHLLHDVADAGCEVFVEGPLAFLYLVSELVDVGLIGLFLDLLAAHAGEEHFFLRQVDVFVLLDGGPDVLHVLRQVGDGDVVPDEVLVAGALRQKFLEVCDAAFPV